jgi:hypothetical protein
VKFEDSNVVKYSERLQRRTSIPLLDLPCSGAQSIYSYMNIRPIEIGSNMDNAVT